MKILYLVSAHAQDDSFFASLANSSLSKIYLVPFEYGCEKRLGQITKICQEKNIAVETIDFLKVFNTSAFERKDDYIRWIYEISEKNIEERKNLKEFYRFDDGEASLWWLSLVNERNPYKSDAFTKFVKTLSVLKLIEDFEIDSLYIDEGLNEFFDLFTQSSLKIPIHFLARRRNLSKVKNNLLFIFLSEQLRHLKAFLSLLIRVLRLRLFLPNRQQRLAMIEKNNVLAFTMFPLIDHQALDKNEFVNRAYGVLHDFLKEKKDKVTWLAMFTKMEGVDWSNAIDFARRIHDCGEDLVFYEECLDVKSFFRLFILDVTTTIKTIFKLNKISKLFYYEFDTVKINFWDIVKRDVLSSFAGKQLFVELGMYYAFDNLLSYLNPQTRLFYFVELHAWENSLNMARRKKASIRTIGLQHTIMPQLLLNYFRDPRELEQNNSIQTFPQPDSLGATGEVTEKLLLESGWDKKKTFIIGGFRFPALLKILKEPSKSLKPPKKQIVVALSISDRENVEIVQMLADAFCGKNLDIKILLKPHPCHDLFGMINRMSVNLDPDVFQITQQPLSAIVPESMAMIVKESSSIFEAMAYEIPVIVPQLFSIVDLCPLSTISNHAIYVYHDEELFECVENIVQNKSQTKNSQQSIEEVRRYLHPFNRTKVLEVLG